MLGARCPGGMPRAGARRIVGSCAATLVTRHRSRPGKNLPLSDSRTCLTFATVISPVDWTTPGCTPIHLNPFALALARAAWELRKHVAILEREISELEG